jgi:hypothetical protein
MVNSSGETLNADGSVPSLPVSRSEDCVASSAAPTLKNFSASPDTSTTDEEPSKHMFDVHAPHDRVHTWKDFFIHIATIVIGLLIAVGLEQTVEYFHHRHQVAETRKALEVERRINANEFGMLTEDFHRVVPELQANIAVYRFLQLHPGAPPEQWPGRLSWVSISGYFFDSAWKTAQQSDVLQYMPRNEVLHQSELYARLYLLNQSYQERNAAKGEATTVAIHESDPAKLSPAQIDRQIYLTAVVLRHEASVARLMLNLNSRYPDFGPSPSAADIHNILHDSADSAAQKEEAALLDRFYHFEQQQRAESDE